MALRSTDIVAPTVLTQVGHESNPRYTATITVDSTIDPDAPTLTVAPVHVDDETRDATAVGV